MELPPGKMASLRYIGAVTHRVAVLPLCLVLVVACGTGEAEREAQQQALASRVRVAADGAIVLTREERELLGLETAPAVPGEVAGGPIVYGVVSASPGSEIEITAPITGTVAGPPDIQLGSRVRRGATLLRLTPSLDTGERASLAAQRQDLQGQISELEHRVAQQDAAAERARKLHDLGIESLAALQSAEADAAAARARLAAARRELSALDRGTIEIVTVGSPADGTVAALEVEAGETVRQGDRLATLLTPGSRRVDVGVPPDAPSPSSFAVEVGGRWRPATLIGSSSVVGADGLRHELLELSDTGAAAEGVAAPGATVRVRLGQRAAGTPGVVLPASAVVPASGGEVVFVVEPDGRYRLRRVRGVERAGERVSVQAGVEAGERVVTRGAMELWGEVVKAGGEAKATPEPTPAAEGDEAPEGAELAPPR
jgi:multidrug efflux pump subunit AcrA (membrane-fusion protein)